MVFSLPHSKWDEPIDHLELFAGVCSISRGEWEDFGGLLRSKSSSQMGHLFLLKREPFLSEDPSCKLSLLVFIEALSSTQYQPLRPPV